MLYGTILDVVYLSIIMLNVTMVKRRPILCWLSHFLFLCWFRYAQCHFVNCCCSECRYPGCHGAKRTTVLKFWKGFAKSSIFWSFYELKFELYPFDRVPSTVSEICFNMLARIRTRKMFNELFMTNFCVGVFNHKCDWDILN